jgi:hypothetical protein
MAEEKFLAFKGLKQYDPGMGWAQVHQFGDASIGKEDTPAIPQAASEVLHDPLLGELFEQLKNAEDGTREAVVSSAFPLDDAQVNNLVADLERKFGCKVKATVEIAPDLIGGIRIALGDQVIDASVRGKLAAMAVSLKN